MQIAIDVVSALCLTIASFECIRALQSVSYRPQRGYFRIYVTIYYLCLVAVQVATLLLYFFVDFYCYINLALYAVLAVCVNVVKRKCPLKFTKRVWRILAVEAIILTVLCVFVESCFFVWLLPLLVLVSWAICLPIDVAIARHYVKLACNKLSESGVTVVAITGSYGKTSVKDMLSALLADSVTPSGSCNTPLGIASFINKTDLTGARYLILEFGARRQGDIAELCKLYKPHCGIVTGVCAQHLSTFKNLETIVATKRELVEYIPQDGFCVLNCADETVMQYVDAGNCTKYPSLEGLQITVKSVDLQGTHLEVHFGKQCANVCLPQISDYVKDTFAMCLQTVLKLNQKFDETLNRISNILPTPHRMELIKGVNCYIIDDSYNASITGVTSCAKTLEHFHCVKVVITQGLVECGKYRKEMNIRCGQILGDVCNVAVVLGSNSKYLAEGLCKTACRVVYAKDLKQAVSLATAQVNGGILLFQNDLPD
ncbi:MAG: hypothetical protein J1G02_00655 [Clostridiales bacterium]|nr:hypothetical protein [Clostridiales bacterium]